jgi:hypothetical protein
VERRTPFYRHAPYDSGVEIIGLRGRCRKSRPAPSPSGSEIVRGFAEASIKVENNQDPVGTVFKLVGSRPAEEA